ncbi:MAG TPA: sugar phosphate isomerase/epimerase family protein [Pirellulales bacterium]|nr:sugar phosphate isomerase/epimerase family protein [Pirellulales bacterium]
MIRSCVTVSLVSEARGGPFVFWDDLPAACRSASELGFDAIEIFPPAPEAVEEISVRRLLDENGLKLAAVGTGAGWVRHKLHLCLPEADKRVAARDFIRRTIDAAGKLGASTIIGSMQGRWSELVSREAALGYLAESLGELGEHARKHGVPLFYEPLNRYETNLCNSLESGVELLESLSTDNVRLLADLFHMNIEEPNIAVAIRTAGRHIGHVHFVDSNRRPAGSGHIDYAPVAAALREIGYDGYVSAEALPYPDSQSAARLTIQAYRKYFPKA